jgi:hypothetical protein
MITALQEDLASVEDGEDQPLGTFLLVVDIPAASSTP